MMCPSATFTGSTALTASASMSFTAAFSGTGSGGSCPAGALGNYKITVSGPWTLNITGGGPGTYTGTVQIPTGSTVTIKPLTVPTCTITITSAGNGALSGLSAASVSPTGFRLWGSVYPVTYTASSGCPGFPAGTRADMVYDTGGNAAFGGISNPGLALSGP